MTVLTTGSSGVSNLPARMITTVAEGVQLDYCDSNKNRRSYPGFWEKVNEDDPQILKYSNNLCFKDVPSVFNMAINNLKELNKNEGTVQYSLYFSFCFLPHC